jgi:hypothetical protein
MIASVYEDGNDAVTLRFDPMSKLALDRLQTSLRDGRLRSQGPYCDGRGGLTASDACGASTSYRGAARPGRYRKVEKHYGYLGPSYVAETVRAAFGTMGIVRGDSQNFSLPRYTLCVALFILSFIS